MLLEPGQWASREVICAAFRSLPDCRQAAPFRMVHRDLPMMETRPFRAIISNDQA
jgi:hypothetical protein